MKKKILVIDDDPDILDAIQFVLEDADYIVKTTEKGEYVQTMHGTNGNLPDLIILDVLLAGMDGRIICRQLKNQKDTKHIPIMMISAHPTAGRSCKEYCADDFLAKPFNIAVLLEKVANLVGQK